MGNSNLMFLFGVDYWKVECNNGMFAEFEGTMSKVKNVIADMADCGGIKAVYRNHELVKINF